jgi:hypothetical protein
MRTEVIAALDEKLGPGWRELASDARQRLDEPAACSLALGLSLA